MKQNKSIQWLHDQLPTLVANGVLSAEAGEALRRHYPIESRSGMPLAFLFFGLLGALLIGAGIILLLAHNWHELGRPMRTAVSLAPLLLAQIITGWVLWRAESSTTWRESAAVFHSLAIAASIAMIAQTYHMPGSFDSFLLTWMLLSLPLVYLLNAVAPLMIYLVGITAWAAVHRGMGGDTLLYWPLAALAVPFVWRAVRPDSYSPRSALVQWSLIITASFALGIVMGHQLPGLWIPLYASLFSGLYLAGGLTASTAERSDWLHPARVFGAATTLVLLFVLTWEWPWAGVDPVNRGWRGDVSTAAAWGDGILAMVLLGFLTTMLTRSIRGRRTSDMLLGVAAPVALCGLALAMASQSLLATLLMNLYLLVVGIGLVLKGVREVRLGVFNTGMAVFSALVLARFFDSDFSFIAKGLVFITLGVAFLACNILLARRKERQP